MYSETEIKSIIEIIKLNVNDNLHKILLFGSYAKDTQTNSSDLDIAIIVNTMINRKEKLRLLNSLWWSASSNGISADFIIKTSDDFENEKELPTLSKTINREGKVLWQSS
ncbi:MAG: nucleotidyltransferase domain-containing protein [FCB group bacterium]|jgi:predicted nucleotidyltransferase